jgi:hypothetical protein
MPTNLYGTNDNYHPENSHVLPALIRRIVTAKKNSEPTITIWGSGTPRREFLHVDDLSDACYFLLKNYNEPGLVNVGCGSDLSIKELKLNTEEQNIEIIKRPIIYNKKQVLGLNKYKSIELLKNQSNTTEILNISIENIYTIKKSINIRKFYPVLKKIQIQNNIITNSNNTDIININSEGTSNQIIIDKSLQSSNLLDNITNTVKESIPSVKNLSKINKFILISKKYNSLIVTNNNNSQDKNNLSIHDSLFFIKSYNYLSDISFFLSIIFKPLLKGIILPISPV